jgi:hypothetical protein
VRLRVFAGTEAINERSENSSPYCAYGDSGPDAEVCGEPELPAGRYRVEAVITANDGSQIVESHEVSVR